MRKAAAFFLVLSLVWAGWVVSDCPIATKVGIEVLRSGGNAVDAAVAVGFALAVTFPQAGNIGGGGFMLIYKNGKVYYLDYREKAPLAATEDMYLDEQGNPIREKALKGALAAGVPGTVAGLLEAHRRFGRLPLKRLLKPAIELAEKGFPLSEAEAKAICRAKKLLSSFPETARIFLPSGRCPKPGEILVQKDLARTLKAIAKKGREGFYSGRVAKLIVRTMRRHGGIISLADLRRYRPVWRSPEVFSFAGCTVYSASLPSSGGLILRQIFRTMELTEAARLYPSHLYYHILAEAMKLAYYDRARFMGDADFEKVPVEGMRSEEYIREKARWIRLLAPLPVEKLSFNPFPYEADETTHFCVLDDEGMGVSNTYTINGLFGCGLVVEGAGFLLNNEMDDFAIKPGTPNMFGAVQGKANRILPEKRMLSSQTPTIVVKDGRIEMLIGSPGGTRIPNAVAQVIINRLLLKMSPQQAMAAPRIHHQYLPDILFVEKSFPEQIRKKLEQMGHKVKVRAYSIGRVNAVFATEKGYVGIADPRASGAAMEE